MQALGPCRPSLRMPRKPTQHVPMPVARRGSSGESRCIDYDPSLAVDGEPSVSARPVPSLNLDGRSILASYVIWTMRIKWLPAASLFCAAAAILCVAAGAETNNGAVGSRCQGYHLSARPVVVVACAASGGGGKVKAFSGHAHVGSGVFAVASLPLYVNLQVAYLRTENGTWQLG